MKTINKKSLAEIQDSITDGLENHFNQSLLQITNNVEINDTDGLRDAGKDLIRMADNLSSLINGVNETTRVEELIDVLFNPEDPEALPIKEALEIFLTAINVTNYE